MKHTTSDLMRFGMKYLLNAGEFDEIIATMKHYFESYENGILLGGEVMDEILVRIEIAAKDFSYVTTEEYSDDSVAVLNVAQKFLLGILFEYIKHSDMQPNDFIKFITNHE